MSDPALRETLARLRAELAATRFADETTRQQLETMIENVECGLADNAGPAHRAGTVEDLSTTIRRYEIEHPRLTATLSDLMLALSSMGI